MYYLWMLFYPVLIFYLIGYEKGRVWVGSLLFIITVFFLLITTGIFSAALDDYALLQSYLALLTISLMAYYFQKMYFDVSSIRQYENSMKTKKLKERMERALTGYNAGAYEWNMVDNSAYLSPQWKRMLGYDEDIVFPDHLSTWKDRVHPDDIDNVMELVRVTLEAKKEYVETIHRLKHKNGQWIWILGRGYIEYDRNGIPVRMTGIHTNITEQKQFEEQLAQAKETAEKALQVKSIFLANMSHEIRTPLNAINGFIGLLAKEEYDPEKLKYLQVIKDASHTLLNTINDILDISKIESGKLNISKVNFRPYKEIMATAELFQAKVSEKGITLNVNYIPGIPEVLYSDILRIKQVIYNLLSNALKFTPENGAISINIKYADHRLHITVADSGIGIEQDKLDYIFESFSQAEESTVREYGGSGLGLSISSQLVQLLGGEINVTSTLGKGSTFSFFIPVETGEMEELEQKPLHDRDIPLTGNILVVEDIAANRMFISLLLKNSGLTYDEAVDGIEAVEKFEAGNYDLILMDENMPRLNGRGATQKIRIIEKEKKRGYTPIIALTANALVGDREKYINAGMDDYLAKPIEPDTLIPILYQYLNSKEIGVR
ncbi:PAS domain-containing hybrid sensor histidine kinase/response regulator [Sulfurovum lithotrophicum]|uniref:PAS domain-containing hybrid sensor histidine kinase/response regulator n=1 Tax=Sulfurovum lithotrophicum TaxID=206403 RepID=UPI00146FEC97|nr:PAS domain-containing hybrid sensor histidine kinase/response regulator [Sulfurovum lithotrophicum]